MNVLDGANDRFPPDIKFLISDNFIEKAIFAIDTKKHSY